GALLAPWFDRDLSCAGRITYRDSAGDLRSALIDFERAVATIPSLAIHLDRGVNDNRSINAQKDIVPVFLQLGAEECSLSELHSPKAFECIPPNFRALLAAQMR